MLGPGQVQSLTGQTGHFTKSFPQFVFQRGRKMRFLHFIQDTQIDIRTKIMVQMDQIWSNRKFTKFLTMSKSAKHSIFAKYFQEDFPGQWSEWRASIDWRSKHLIFLFTVVASVKLYWPTQKRDYDFSLFLVRKYSILLFFWSHLVTFSFVHKSTKRHVILI